MPGRWPEMEFFNHHNLRVYNRLDVITFLCFAQEAFEKNERFQLALTLLYQHNTLSDVLT